ncbi:MAG TPA: universal stress protein [Actinomycetota bacterium]|nr:universal stress protein [Actinomycetota bacterium]
MYQRIVAGTDLSKTAKFATDRAATLASSLGAELFLVHAGTDPGDELKQQAEEYGAEVVVTPGSPAEVLISEVQRLDADLLVVGSVGMSGARRFLLGSVPNKVSHHSPTDLLIVKTDPPPREIGPYRRLLVGTDGSPTATRAVKIAAGLAAKLNAQPVIVCAFEPLTEAELARLRADPNDPVAQWNASKVASETPDEFRWRIADAVKAEDVLERAKEIAVAEGALPKLRPEEGHPVERLISVAEEEEVDLIAVGSVGMTGPKRFMLGNVPNRISHHAPTDVLILHTS